VIGVRPIHTYVQHLAGRNVCRSSQDGHKITTRLGSATPATQLVHLVSRHWNTVLEFVQCVFARTMIGNLTSSMQYLPRRKALIVTELSRQVHRDGESQDHQTIVPTRDSGGGGALAAFRDIGPTPYSITEC
jgi:hypothetical protein